MKYKNNVPIIEKGINCDQINFSGGRLAVSMAKHGGLTRLYYFGDHPLNRCLIYRGDPISVWTKLFRPYVIINKKMYYLEFSSTSIFPSGYQSTFKVAGVTLTHEMILLNDTLAYRVKVKKNPQKAKIQLKLLHNDQQVHNPFNNREWSDYTFNQKYNALIANAVDIEPNHDKKKDHNQLLTQRDDFGYREPERSEIWVGATSKLPVTCHKTPNVFNKSYLTTSDFKDCAHLFITFSTTRRKLYNRLSALKKNITKETDSVIESFNTRMRTQSKIQMPNQVVQSCLSTMSPLLDSLRVPDIQGGMRAADAHYWIWGWDSMVYAESVLIAGQHKLIRDILLFYKNTAHPEKGIFHALSARGNPTMSMAPAAQCLYITVLYYYYSFTEDKKLLAELYPFIIQLLERAQQDEVAGTGLLKGVSLYPDYPEHVDQNGNDISVFNNSIYYQALKAGSVLAEISGENEYASALQARAERLRKGFRKYLYDRKKGYFIDSISSEDLSKRKHYPSYAILWVTPFAEDLVQGIIEPVASFMQKNLKVPIGVSLYPKWDTCFMQDGNQLGMYMPVNEPFYRNMMRLSGRIEETKEWEKIVSWSWNQLTILESLAAEAENAGITLDEPGRKQAFAAKAWYAIFVRCVMGLDFGTNGITISQPTGKGDISIANISFTGKRVTAKITGNGKYVGTVTLNGKKLDKATEIPKTILKANNKIEIRRSTTLSC